MNLNTITLDYCKINPQHILHLPVQSIPQVRVDELFLYRLLWFVGRLESIENELRYLRDENTALKKEAAVREAKLQANIRSIKTFWSPELKKERNARKEEQLRAGL